MPAFRSLLAAGALLPLLGCEPPTLPQPARQIERRWTLPGTPPRVPPAQDTVAFLVAGLREYETNPLRRWLAKEQRFWLLLRQEQDTAVQVNMLLGLHEAQEVALAIEQLPAARPQPSMLLQNTITALGYRLRYVVIDRLENGVFAASMYLAGPEGRTQRIDCRPADAVTQALRWPCRLYVLRDVAIASELSYY